MKTTSYPDPVRKLLSIGDARSMRKWPNCLKLGISEEHIPDLIRMLTDDDLNMADSKSSEVWAPLHAWRALGQLRAVEAIDVLIRQFQRIEEEDDDWVGEELPTVMAMIGPPAISALAAYLENDTPGLYAKICAAHSLANIGESSPEDRDEAVQILTALLGRCEQNDPTLNGFIIGYLMDLKAVESIRVIRKAFHRDSVDEMVVGDLEDVELELGLRQSRSTPTPLDPWIHEEDLQTSRSTWTVPAGRKIGRNDPCPCGSGKKYKKCCLGRE